jgi:hypothetical protein
MKKINYLEYIENNIINNDYSRRGGSIKIDVSELFPYIEEAVMGAYQNYLGGGLLGAVVGASMFNPEELKKEDQDLFHELKEQIKEYFFNITNDEATEYDEWNNQGYMDNQNMPVSAY